MVFLEYCSMTTKERGMRQEDLREMETYFRKRADGEDTYRLLLSIQRGIDEKLYAMYTDLQTEETRGIMVSSFARWADGVAIPSDPFGECLEQCSHDLTRGVTIKELLGGDNPDNPNPGPNVVSFQGTRAVALRMREVLNGES